jgi:hypothetical protein
VQAQVFAQGHQHGRCWMGRQSTHQPLHSRKVASGRRRSW